MEPKSNQNSSETSVIFRLYSFLSVIAMFVILWIIIRLSRPWGFKLFNPLTLMFIIILVLLIFTVYGSWLMKPWLMPLLIILLIGSLISTGFTLIGNAMSGSRSIIGPLFFFGSFLYLLATIFVLIKFNRYKHI